jgi:hypothetical protein
MEGRLAENPGIIEAAVTVQGAVALSLNLRSSSPTAEQSLPNAYFHNPWYKNWGQFSSASANASLTNHLRPGGLTGTADSDAYLR